MRKSNLVIMAGLIMAIISPGTMAGSLYDYYMANSAERVNKIKECRGIKNDDHCNVARKAQKDLFLKKKDPRGPTIGFKGGSR